MLKPAKCLYPKCAARADAHSRFRVCLRHHQKIMAYRKRFSVSRRYWSCVHNAQARTLRFELTIEKFAELTSLSCVYCGLYSEASAGGWCGLDRIDDSDGYTLTNVWPACARCNKARGTQSPREFLEMCHRIAAQHPRDTPLPAPPEPSFEARLLRNYDKPLPKGRPRGTTAISIRERIRTQHLAIKTRRRAEREDRALLNALDKQEAQRRERGCLYPDSIVRIFWQMQKECPADVVLLSSWAFSEVCLTDASLIESYGRSYFFRCGDLNVFAPGTDEGAREYRRILDAWGGWSFTRNRARAILFPETPGEEHPMALDELRRGIAALTERGTLEDPVVIDFDPLTRRPKGPNAIKAPESAYDPRTRP